ncbi:hypothetical protein [Streptomyces avicenniae]|uniref:hypothetical protein n=1 Tax=Streptomyces avicenniae TaxID=500153 RepID=UPI00069AAFCC|nr:hypothetical protein [Streptomyces avicenniae]
MDSAHLGSIRTDAASLGRIALQGGQAAGSTYGAVPELRSAGFDSGDALHHAMWRFTQQSLHLAADCDHIAEHLGATVTAHAGLEADIEAGLAADAAALPQQALPLNLGISAL